MPAKKVTKTATAKKNTATKAVVKKTAAKKTTTKQPVAKKPAASPKASAKKVSAAAKAPAEKAAKTAAKKPAAKKKTTTIVVTFDVGMGNNLVLRGDGPGLNWKNGTIMENIDANTWGWKTTTAKSAFEVKFLVNDKTWSQGENFTIKPGTKSGFAPSF